MGDLSPQHKAAAVALWARMTEARQGPTGSWAQRWIPGVCPHPDVRCVHGDEIAARAWRRRVCRVCGRALRGELPIWCWFTDAPHDSTKPAAVDV